MRTAFAVGVAFALGLAGCAPQVARLPQAPVAAGPQIAVVAQPVAEWSSDAPPRPASRFVFAGGLHLTAPGTSRFHGVSDLEVLPDGRFVAITDEGDLLRGRIVLDRAGRPTGLGDVTLTPLASPEGGRLSGAKADSDSEGLALWPNGDLMVSFERNHRIWLYPAGGGPPRPVPSPEAPFPANDGMEALAVDPQAGPDAYVVGREDSRETWTCRISAGCTRGPQVAARGGANSLVAVRGLPGGRWAFLLRGFTPATGASISIVVADRAGQVIDHHDIRQPATVDNFEGLAALPRPDGSVRFYLLSDDNFSSLQRTLLLAFDWTPPQ